MCEFWSRFEHSPISNGDWFGFGRESRAFVIFHFPLEAVTANQGDGCIIFNVYNYHVECGKRTSSTAGVKRFFCCLIFSAIRSRNGKARKLCKEKLFVAFMNL